ncbi:RDD family protein [Verrucomicrobiota bacterium]
MIKKQKTLIIQTPEGIIFPFLLASPVTRLLALCIDQACIALLMIIIGILARLTGLISYDIANAFIIASGFLIFTGYPIVFEWCWRGQTLGKKLLGLQVLDEQGLNLEFSQVVIRNLMRIFDSLPAFYMVGGLTSLLNSKGQRIGDITASTIVVYHPKTAEPDLSQILADKYNSFRSYPHIAARLRQKILPREAGVFLQAVLRRDILEPQARLALFAGIRSYMEKTAKFPSEAVESISDEKYVRNVVDILFRSGKPSK